MAQETAEEFLSRIFYDPKHSASYQGAQKLYEAAKGEFPGVLGIRKIRKWLEKQEVYSINRPLKRTFRRNRVVVQKRFDQFDADLADFQKLAGKNNGVKFLLVVIDVFSRYVWVEPLKSKANSVVVNGFKAIFARGQQPRRLRTDSGKEFTGDVSQKYFDKQNIEHFVTLNEEIKAGYAERVIRTLKTKLWRYMKQNRKYRYIDILQDMVDSYNNTKHSSIKMPPSEVSSGDVERLLFWSQYKPDKPYKTPIKKDDGEIIPVKKPIFRYKKGEHVRISHSAKVFDRAYNEKWSLEIFIIDKTTVREGVKIYKIKDLLGEDIQGHFYESEIQRAEYTEDREWDVEAIEQKRNKGQEVLVKWRGWPKKFNSWVSAASIVDFE